jgi:AcrR family transcriptional regulator
MAQASKPGKYHHGDLRRVVIDTALLLIAEQGIESLTLREIAQQIGVSRMAPYRHFESKAMLLVALAQEGFQLLFAHLQTALSQSATNPLCRLQTIGVAYILYAVANPVHYRVMFDSSLSNRKIHPELYATALQSFTCLLEIITECQQQQLIRAGDAQEIAQINWSLVHGLSMLYIDRQFATMGCAPIEELANAAMQSLIAGIHYAAIASSEPNK